MVKARNPKGKKDHLKQLRVGVRPLLKLIKGKRLGFRVRFIWLRIRAREGLL